jgi:hypothetical protein
MTPYIDFSQSITADNGKEFAGHEEIAKASEIPGQPKNVMDNVKISDFDRLTSKKLTK